MDPPVPRQIERIHPLHHEPEARWPETQSGTTPREGVALRGMCILIVDDDDDSRFFLQLILEHYGATVSAAATVGDAIREFQRCAPDLLLSDIDMPGLDGFDLIRQVRTLREGTLIPAIALTGYSGPQHGRDILEAGYTVHLSKPMAPAELVAAVVAMTNVPRAPCKGCL